VEALLRLDRAARQRRPADRGAGDPWDRVVDGLARATDDLGQVWPQGEPDAARPGQQTLH
jgi:hypothetical protein